MNPHLDLPRMYGCTVDIVGMGAVIAFATNVPLYPLQTLKLWDLTHGFFRYSSISSYFPPVPNTCAVGVRIILPTSLPCPLLLCRGGRIELRYHKDCFSNIADPRSQPASSANVGKFVQSLRGTVAPEELYRKMRTRGHW